MNRLSLFHLSCWLCWLGVSGLAAAGPQDLARKIISPDAVLTQSGKLGLSSGQREDVERELKAQRAALAEPLSTMQRASETLLEQLSREKPNEQAVLACFDELNAAETALKRARLATTVRLMHLLTPAQIAILQTSAQSAQNSTALASDVSGAPVAELLRQVRTGIEAWRKEGRDLSTVNALWDRFRSQAEKQEHAEARKTLQELNALLSAPAPAQSR